MKRHCLLIVVMTFILMLSVGEARSEKVKLVVAGDGGNNQVAWLWAKQQMETEFNVELEIIPLSFEDLYTKLKAEFVGETGAYDIVVYFPKYMGDFIENGYLLPLDEYIAKWDPAIDDIIPAFHILYDKWGGKTYTLPYDGDVLALFYRTDLFSEPSEKANFQEKYGYELRPPETWDEYMDVAEFFTRQPGDLLMGEKLVQEFYGTATYGQKDFQYCWYMNYAASMGVMYFDEQMNPGINSPEAVKALEMYKKEFQYCPPENISFGFDELQAAFLNGQVAMEIQWTDPGRVGQNPEISKIAGKIGTALIPGFKKPDGSVNHKAVMAAGRVIAVTKWAEDPEVAYQVARFMTQEASLGYVSSPETGMDPFRLSHYANPGAFEMFPTPEDAADYLNGIKLNLMHGFPELTIPGAQQYLDTLAVNISKYLASDNLSAQQVLDETAERWNQITETLGRDKMINVYKAMLESVKEAGLAID